MVTGQILAHWDVLINLLRQTSLTRCELDSGCVFVGFLVPREKAHDVKRAFEHKAEAQRLEMQLRLDDVTHEESDSSDSSDPIFYLDSDSPAVGSSQPPKRLKVSAANEHAVVSNDDVVAVDQKDRKIGKDGLNHGVKAALKAGNTEFPAASRHGVLDHSKNGDVVNLKGASVAMSEKLLAMRARVREKMQGTRNEKPERPTNSATSEKQLYRIDSDPFLDDCNESVDLTHAESPRQETTTVAESGQTTASRRIHWLASPPKYQDQFWFRSA